jgi:hypothetical protein
MFQNIAATTTRSLNNFILKFASGFFESGSEKEFILNSTAFKIGGVDHYFGDKVQTGSGRRTVIVYKKVNGVNVTVINNAGEMDIAKGSVVIHSFTVDTPTTIKINVIPNSLDIAPKRDQLLNIDQTYVSISAEVDTISTAGASGSIDYTTSSRLR